ncbi:MAG: carbamoyltransferase [Planctomycetaceae bacterium]|nr:carbamoyltransferase [Planctomycetaceae bacterium]
MTAVLGISAFYHDAAAALVVDGRIVAAVQEERFSRVKNDSRFPESAITFCLQEAGLTANKIDYVVFYEKPLLKLDRVLETYCAFAPRGFRSFRRGVPSWAQCKLHTNREVRRVLGCGFQKRLLFAEHHESHAASAFYPSPFDEAAILTVDGVGEWATATCGIGRGQRVELTHEVRFPHSLGLLYSAFTHYCGFEVDAGEYKLMGLAPCGTPRFADVILERLIDLKPDGSFRLDLSYFDYCTGLTMTSRRFHQLFGGPPRRPNAAIEVRHMDLAASIQRVTEEILLRMAQHAHEQSGMRKLCLAGGVALNCVANSRIVREGAFDDVWIQPAAGDAGGALGAALLVWHQLLEQPRSPHPDDAQQGSLLGPEYPNHEVRAALQSQGAVFHNLADDAALVERTAALLAEQKVVGWMQGRMEFGPRALGSRSILADARNPEMQRVLNEKIKLRESFRPFAPSVLDEFADRYFEMPREQRSPYMLLVGSVAQSQFREQKAWDARMGADRLNDVHSSIPAVTHVDHSARVQTVDDVRHPKLASLLRAFHARTGCPLLINTSFNIKDEPIVCSPVDAFRCFLSTGIDVLVIDSYLLLKSDQPADVTSPTPAGPHPLAGGWFAGDGGDAANVTEDPTPRQLQTFGWGLALASLALFIVALTIASRWRGVPASMAVALFTLFSAYALFPRLRRPLLRSWMIATAPLTWLSSQAALAVTYYLVLTPIGVCRRLIGRDSMARRPETSSTTYWQVRRPPADQAGYLRQF